MKLIEMSITVRTIAGARKIHGNVSAARWPSAIRVPSETFGDCTPNPKNDSAVSDSTAFATPSVASMISSDEMLGRMCLKMIVIEGTDMYFAAVTYSALRTDSVRDRTTRADSIQPNSASSRMKIGIEPFFAPACWEKMAAGGGGAIVNQSSTAAWLYSGFYGLAKVGVNGLTQQLANELGGSNIRVNAIAPGPIDTEANRTSTPQSIVNEMVDKLPLKRIGQPEDLVGMLLFLLSDEAGWITGQIFNVDGGQVIRS